MNGIRPEGRRALIGKGVALSGLLMLPACASPGQYMGIDTSPSAQVSALTPEQQNAERERQILMLIAVLNGCYERVPGGFRTIPAEEARNTSCTIQLADIEVRSTSVGARSRGPSSFEAMDLSSLAGLASTGSKHAQLELGIRFEEGIGMIPDLKKAHKLYGLAASNSGGTIWVYSPPVGNGTTGRVIPINTGPVRPGLPEAKRRLEELRANYPELL